MEHKFEYHNYDVNIVGSYYALKNLVDSGTRKVHSRYSHLDYLESHLYLVQLVLEREGKVPNEFLDNRWPLILKSSDYSFITFFCMELVTRPRPTLPHFLSHQMENFFQGEDVFLEVLKNGVLTYLLHNDPFQDESLLQFINDWVDKKELHAKLVKSVTAQVSKNMEEEHGIKKKGAPSVQNPNEVYKHILKTIDAIGRFMEKKPSLYKGRDEGELRDLILWSLDSRYERTTATSETFNVKGKTDILVQSDEGVNLFIAECKIWSGVQSMHNAISQLFDNYIGWRDTKTALLLFVKNKNFSNVIENVTTEILKHKYYLNYAGKNSETSISYYFRTKNDAKWQVELEVMLFSFPET